MSEHTVWIKETQLQPNSKLFELFISQVLHNFSPFVVKYLN